MDEARRIHRAATAAQYWPATAGASQPVSLDAAQPHAPTELVPERDLRHRATAGKGHATASQLNGGPQLLAGGTGHAFGSTRRARRQLGWRPVSDHGIPPVEGF